MKRTIQSVKTHKTAQSATAVFLASHKNSSLSLSLSLIAIFTTATINLLITNVSYAATTVTVSDNINISASPSSTQNTFTSDTSSSNISVSTDNISGYTLLLKSDSNTSPALTGTNGSIPSISSETSTINNITNNTYGYKPTKKNGNTWNNLVVQHGDTTYTSGYYLPGPTTTDDILDTTDVANTTANEYNLALATKLDLSTPSGSYGNTFTVTVVPNELPYILLTFDANGGTFDGGSTINVLTYSIPETTYYTPDTKTTSSTDSNSANGNHKTNIDDSTQYPIQRNGYSYYQDVTLNTTAPPPYDLKIYFAIGNGHYYKPYTYICVFDGNSYIPTYDDGCIDFTAVTPVVSGNGSGIADGKVVFSGGISQTYTNIATYRLYSKTARIYFTAAGMFDEEDESYGFWAEFTGGGNVATQNLISGAYIEKPSNRSDYVFLGWATTPNAIQPNWTYNPGTIKENSQTLYAVWSHRATSFDEAFSEAGKSKQNGYYKMQDMSNGICAAVQPNTTTQLIDARDNKLYWISKLADDHCWMTQNLDFVISTSGTTLKTTDSNILSDKTITIASGDHLEGGDKYLPNGRNSATPITCTSSSNGGENCHYHVGNYYRYSIATANSGTFFGDAPESICPKGWRLPTSGSYTKNYSFGALTNAYGITDNAMGTTDAKLLINPLWFVRSGYDYYGSTTSLGQYGYFSSSLANGNGGAYALAFNSSSVSPLSSFHTGYGFNIRCVAQ